eukprot:m.79932 g.79932  ORF g.79932 m.79932 type:complete len:191 (-) comp16291_c0_seq10:1372-1944(-)
MGKSESATLCGASEHELATATKHPSHTHSRTLRNPRVSTQTKCSGTAVYLGTLRKIILLEVKKKSFVFTLRNLVTKYPHSTKIGFSTPHLQAALDLDPNTMPTLPGPMMKSQMQVRHTNVMIPYEHDTQMNMHTRAITTAVRMCGLAQPVTCPFASGSTQHPFLPVVGLKYCPSAQKPVRTSDGVASPSM